MGKEFGKIDAPKGSSLLGKSGDGHASQSGGHSIGNSVKGQRSSGLGTGSRQIFPTRGNPMGGGSKSGHQIGKRPR